MKRSVLAACFQGPGIDDGGGTLYDNPLAVDVEGTVVAAGQGEPPDPCFRHVGGGAVGQLGAYVGEGDQVAEARWATVEREDGTRFTLGALAPGETPLELAVGDVLAVELRLRVGGFTPTYASLTVRDGKTGDLRFWFGQGDGADTLEPPDELSLGPGETVCRDQNECIDGFLRRDMVVEVAGQSAVLPYAGRVDLHDLRVVSGGFEEQTGESRCADAFVAWAAAAAWPRP